MKFSTICKIEIFLIVTLFNLMPTLAEETYLRDVPEGHYAYDAVYDLIKQGITKGYPDGTFRGKNLMTRYELASFLSKLIRSINLQRGKNEKLLEELKSEFSLIEYQVSQEKIESKICGSLDGRWRKSSLGGGRADYRLKLNYTRNFLNQASLKINLDTMDSGFNGVARDLVRELLDFEGKVNLGSFSIKATAGPGDVTHNDDLFLVENGMKYVRPRRAIYLVGSLGKTGVDIGYISRSTDSNGLIGVAEVNLKISQNYPLFNIVFNPRYFYNQVGEHDLRLELSAQFKPLSLDLLYGIAKTADFPHGVYLRGKMECGEEFKLMVQKVGSQYREKFTYSIFDIFNRNLPDDSVNLGLEFSKRLGTHWLFKIRGDYTNPNRIQSTEVKLGYKFSSFLLLETFYQSYQSNDFSWSLGVGFSSKF